MKASKLMTAALVSMMMLSACAKKDDSFKARYANGNGAGAGTSANAAVADQAVDSAGIMVDILSLQTTSKTNPLVFTANVLVGSTYKPVSITINSVSTVVSGSTTIGSYTVNLFAECGNADCDPAYFQVDAYLNGVAKIQTGYKFRRYSADSSSDRYTRFAAPLKSFSDMITYLDSLN